MKTRWTCAMNGAALDEIDESVAIKDIREGAAEYAMSTGSNAKYDGLRVLRRVRESVTVEIVAEIRQRDPARRAAVMDKLSAWCQDGVLTVGYRPGQRLRCICVQRPSVESALRWTREVTIRFTAYAMPWWEDESPAEALATGSGAGVLHPGGTAAETLVEAEVTNTSDTVAEEVEIRCGNTMMRFSGLGLAAGEKLLAVYDEAGLLRLRMVGEGGERSAMDKREAASSDDLVARSQQDNLVAVSADAAVEAVFRVRGRYV